MATAPTYPAATGPISIAKRILDSDTTAIVDVYDNSAGSVAVKVESLVVTTDNTADRILKMYLCISTVSYLFGSKTITTLAGTNGGATARVNMMATLGIAGADGVPCIWIPAGTKLQASVDAALASGKIMYIVGRVFTFV